jgi:hypothetical protein
MAVHRHDEQNVDPDSWLAANAPREGWMMRRAAMFS